ncbi:MAG: GTPase Era [Firmicutes bacterium]|nr:GTPase Era [Bacillota bacterium]
MKFKSGFISIVGRPNVGKSTLINRIAGEKISIVSDKHQTTRNAVKAIVTDSDCQMVFIDTPGIVKPKNKLGEYMVKVALESLDEVDVILFMTEGTGIGPGKGDIEIMEQLKKTRTPVFLIINKIDIVKKENILTLIPAYEQYMNFNSIIPISAMSGEGVDILLEEIMKVLPPGPKYFPDDILTDQPEKFIVAEIIREKFLMFLKQEVPHGIGVEIVLFKEREGKNLLDIEANVYCEKESHKGIIIGKNGEMLKKAGTLAREEIERFLGVRVFLQLWVKVKKDWRNSDFVLKTLGYN